MVIDQDEADLISQRIKENVDLFTIYKELRYDLNSGLTLLDIRSLIVNNDINPVNLRLNIDYKDIFLYGEQDIDIFKDYLKIVTSISKENLEWSLFQSKELGYDKSTYINIINKTDLTSNDVLNILKKEILFCIYFIQSRVRFDLKKTYLIIKKSSHPDSVKNLVLNGLFSYTSLPLSIKLKELNNPHSGIQVNILESLMSKIPRITDEKEAIKFIEIAYQILINVPKTKIIRERDAKNYINNAIISNEFVPESIFFKELLNINESNVFYFTENKKYASVSILLLILHINPGLKNSILNSLDIYPDFDSSLNLSSDYIEILSKFIATI